MQEPESKATSKPQRNRSAGGRPKCAPCDLRDRTIEVRMSAREKAVVREKAKAVCSTPGRFMRDSALSRRLPPMPAPAINREQYAELAKLSGNLNQLSRAVNSGLPVTVNDEFLQILSCEVGRLRLALIGAGGRE